MWYHTTITIISLLLVFGNLTSQNYFNVLPELESFKNQGVCRSIICNDSSFYIIGHKLDTTASHSIVNPWLGKFDYSGNQIFHKKLMDTLSVDPFYADIILKARK